MKQKISKEDLKKLVAEPDLNEPIEILFQLMQNYLDEVDDAQISNACDDLILISGKFKNINHDKISGIIDAGQANIETNRVRKNVLDSINAVPLKVFNFEATGKQIHSERKTNFPFEPEMVFVKGGAFKMGSNKNDKEKPIHRVTVNDFKIGKFQITVEQFKAFIDDEKYVTEAERFGNSFINDSGWKFKKGVTWKCDIAGITRPLSDYNHPVIHVSWNDAIVYCNWLSKKNKEKYHLPSEAEWEFAARGGTQSKEYIYCGSNNINEVAWYDRNSGNRTHEIGTTAQPNELGIYDMSGNVWEWCEDDWNENYVDAPIDGKSWHNKNYKETCCVLRGGSWDFLDVYCRVSSRNKFQRDYRSSRVGFRLALSVSVSEV